MSLFWIIVLALLFVFVGLPILIGLLQIVGIIIAFIFDFFLGN